MCYTITLTYPVMCSGLPRRQHYGRVEDAGLPHDAAQLLASGCAARVKAVLVARHPALRRHGWHAACWHGDTRLVCPLPVGTLADPLEQEVEMTDVIVRRKSHHGSPSQGCVKVSACWASGARVR